MLFSLQHFPLLYLLKASIETVTSCKYLRIVIDDNLSIKPHIEHLLRKLEVGPLFLKSIVFLFHRKKKACCYHFFTSPGLRWYNLHEHLCSFSPSFGLCLSQDTLWFMTGSKPLTHHCTLYFLAGPRWPYAGWFTGIIYKSICDLLPAYISDYMLHKHLSHSLQSLHYIHRSISLYRTWKTRFSFSAPCSWKTLQKDLQLSADFTCRCKRRTHDPVKSSLGTYSYFWHDCANITLFLYLLF